MTERRIVGIIASSLLILPQLRAASSQDITVNTPGFPKIELKNVIFEKPCASSKYSTCPFFDASLSFDGSPAWHSLTLSVVTHLKDGGVYRYEVEGSTDNSGDVVRFSGAPYDTSIPFSSEQVSSSEVIASRGIRKEKRIGKAFKGVIAKDEGCLKDLVKAEKLEGLARRKALADLLTYGCVEFVDAPGEECAEILHSKTVPGAVLVTHANSGTGWIMESQIQPAEFSALRSYPQAETAGK